MKEALVIGASGGIGAALAAELYRRGARVTALSRKLDGLDVTDPDSVATHLGALAGPFDTIVLATGILAPEGMGPEKALSQVSPEQMARTFAVNTLGPALVLAEVERLLPRRDPSRVGVLSARVGSIGDNRIGGWHSYRASKAAVNQIVRGAAIEIGRKRKEAAIVALHPGTVDTPFTADYPGHSKVAADEAARNLCDVLASLTPGQTGRFFAWDGSEIPW
ncbi:SDR family NAD(P)-dependent oxidoreductase [Histidinibacterium lentulum]|uniref:SDR family NAD(P)-dependent oxidoreductase n=1 Tax=Histidinibacterium lentulum TaxID=2480588 RepID=A0A3N2R835_9RHOB|nr:SDR family NAD(P)-dependent oxidoreductase [Histidinibacterium lentulum]ROU03597.1 SDR family NAD(P)-dependent oxidoreductase [Histidinibacterium lentulum]